MRSSRLALLLLLCLWTAPPALGAVDNVVVQWNNVLQGAVRTLGIPNQVAARLYGLLALAQYRALTVPVANTFPISSAAHAGHAILSGLFPWNQSNSFDLTLAAQLAASGEAPLPTVVRDAALAPVTKLLRDRIGGPASRWANFTPSPPGGPVGRYQFTPGQTFALYPQLANDFPFVVPSLVVNRIVGNRNRAAGPVFLPNRTDYNATFLLGNATAPQRSQYDTDSAAFWADGANTSDIGGHFFQIAALVLPSSLTVPQTALAYARLGTAAYDASIACWRVKYNTLHWRPITAARQGSPGYAPQPNWTPLLRTPPHPEYPSGHQCTAGALLEVLVQTLGTDQVTFTIGTEGALLAPRTYTNLTAAAVEVGDSRLYGGVHFPSANADGLTLGQVIARQVVTLLT